MTSKSNQYKFASLSDKTTPSDVVNLTFARVLFNPSWRHEDSYINLTGISFSLSKTTQSESDS